MIADVTAEIFKIRNCSIGNLLYGHGGHLGHVTRTVWTNFPSPIPWRLHMIGPVVSVEKMFKESGPQTDDRQMTEAFGSAELKNKNWNKIDIPTQFSVFLTYYSKHNKILSPKTFIPVNNTDTEACMWKIKLNKCNKFKDIRLYKPCVQNKNTLWFAAMYFSYFF